MKYRDIPHTDLNISLIGLGTMTWGEQNTEAYNSWPREMEPTRFKLFKENRSNENPMQRQKRVDELGK